jgi:hypothetical protein
MFYFKNLIPPQSKPLKISFVLLFKQTLQQRLFLANKNIFFQTFSRKQKTLKKKEYKNKNFGILQDD